MREITLWRWVFGLALVLTVPVFWFPVVTSDGDPILGLVALFVVIFLANLLVSMLVIGLALWAYEAAFRFASFMAELLGLRQLAPSGPRSAGARSRRGTELIHLRGLPMEHGDDVGWTWRRAATT